MGCGIGSAAKIARPSDVMRASKLMPLVSIARDQTRRRSERESDPRSQSRRQFSISRMRACEGRYEGRRKRCPSPR
jgi:hypothetical protein